jgi:hypothetical protein
MWGSDLGQSLTQMTFQLQPKPNYNRLIQPAADQLVKPLSPIMCFSHQDLLNNSQDLPNFRQDRHFSCLDNRLGPLIMGLVCLVCLTGFLDSFEAEAWKSYYFDKTELIIIFCGH